VVGELDGAVGGKEVVAEDGDVELAVAGGLAG
jgi:hypothetical protein